MSAASNPTITVVGEALVDLVISPEGGVEAVVGGAPFNSARTCGRHGADVRFVSAVSTDRFGQMLFEQLRSDGVSLDDVARVEAPTTLAAAEVDPSGAASYRFYIDGTSAPMLTKLPRRGGVWFTGGLGLVLEPMAGAIERALQERSVEPTVLMVDINCRPSIVPDRARYLERVERVVSLADIVKVSDEDLAYLAPGSAPLVAARALLESGPSVVLFTAGALGARLLTRAAERLVPAQRAAVVDTVGAGDAFVGGFLVAWTRSGEADAFDEVDRLVATAEFGARVASVVVGRKGADVPWSHKPLG